MPTAFTIDPIKRVIHFRVSGVLTDGEVLRVRETVRVAPGFDPDFAQLFDMTDTENIDLTAEAVRGLATASVFSARARRAFVAPSDFQYGMARMFAIHSETSGYRVEIFRTVDEALDWLERT